MRVSGGQSITFQSHFFPSTMWLLRIELRPPGLTSAFTCQAFALMCLSKLFLNTVQNFLLMQRYLTPAVSIKHCTQPRQTRTQCLNSFNLVPSHQGGHGNDKYQGKGARQAWPSGSRYCTAVLGEGLEDAGPKP